MCSLFFVISFRDTALLLPHMSEIIVMESHEQFNNFVSFISMLWDAGVKRKKAVESF